MENPFEKLHLEIQEMRLQISQVQEAIAQVVSSSKIEDPPVMSFSDLVESDPAHRSASSWRGYIARGIVPSFKSQNRRLVYRADFTEFLTSGEVLSREATNCTINNTLKTNNHDHKH